MSKVGVERQCEMKITLTQHQIEKIVEMDRFIRMSKAWLRKGAKNNDRKID